MEYMSIGELLELDQHDPQVQYQIALRYLCAEGVQKDKLRAEQWLRRAVEQGHEEAYRVLFTGKVPDAAVPLTGKTLPAWRKRAEDGDARAQYAVARYLMREQNPEDLEEIQRYMAAAADQGHGMACVMMGRQYLEYDDDAEAVKYLKKACDSQVPEAALLMSECFWHGKGVDADPAQAEKMLCDAARWGNAEMMLHAAARFEAGWCVERNHGRALGYLGILNSQGMENAQTRFEALSDSLRVRKLDGDGRTEAAASDGKPGDRILYEPRHVLAMARLRNELVGTPILHVGGGGAVAAYLLSLFWGARGVQALIPAAAVLAAAAALWYYLPRYCGWTLLDPSALTDCIDRIPPEDADPTERST